MLNYFIAYCLPMSFVLCALHHCRVIVPGLESNGLWGLGARVVRLWIQGFFMTVAFFREGLMNPLGDGYTRWWVDYTSEHSAIIWFTILVPVTIGLWAVKTITFSVAKKPGFYSDPDRPMPSLHKINMWTPLFWNTVFWAWLLCNPLMPFWTCWVQGWLRR